MSHEDDAPLDALRKLEPWMDHQAIVDRLFRELAQCQRDLAACAESRAQATALLEKLYALRRAYVGGNQMQRAYAFELICDALSSAMFLPANAPTFAQPFRNLVPPAAPEPSEVPGFYQSLLRRTESAESQLAAVRREALTHGS